MISPRAIEAYFAKQPEPIFPVRGKDPEWLLDVIKKTTKCDFRPKRAWTGSDRDVRQLEAITLSIVKKRLLLYYAPRTGKTRISLDWIQHLRRCDWVRRALVVPHAPVGLDEWEIQTPVESDLQGIFIRSGPRAGLQLCDALESDCDFVCVAPSTLQTLFSEKRLNRRGVPKLYVAKEALAEMAGFYDAFVCDEIHGAMWQASLRHEIVVGLAHHADWRLGLTGTPFGRDPFGLWGQSYIIDGGATLGRTYYFFEQAFGREVYNHFTPTKTSLEFNPKMMEALQARMAHMTLACSLEEIQDVEVIASVVKLKMSRQQEKAYKQLIDDMVRAQQEDTKKVTSIFVRLRQVSSGFQPFNDEDGEQKVIEFADAPKYEWLSDLLANLGSTGVKVVVFHEFVATGQRLKKLCEKLKISHDWLWGGTKDKMTTRMGFQEGDTQVLIANWQTGGTAVNLSAADYMCVFESPTGVIARTQMMARPMARSRPLLVDDLVCSPVEEKILTFHEQGKELMDQFRGGGNLAKELAL